MKTTEGNKLIAEFMGSSFKTYKKGHIRKYSVTVCYFDDGMSPFAGGVSIENLKYHSSWDWLMPVVEKIERIENYRNIKFDISIKNYCGLSFYHKTEKVDCFGNFKLLYSRGYSSENRITAVWLACVEFIKWYNENKS